METYLEMLDKPEVKLKIESSIGGLIMEKYRKERLQPPIPTLSNGTFVYADPAANKFAERLRLGAAIYANALDELNKPNEEKAPE